MRGHSFSHLPCLQVPKCVDFLAFWTLSLWCSQYCWEKTPDAVRKCLFAAGACAPHHICIEHAGSFSSETLCRLWARNRRLLEVSPRVLMPSFTVFKAGAEVMRFKNDKTGILLIFALFPGLLEFVFQLLFEIMMARKFLWMQQKWHMPSSQWIQKSGAQKW